MLSDMSSKIDCKYMLWIPVADIPCLQQGLHRSLYIVSIYSSWFPKKEHKS